MADVPSGRDNQTPAPALPVGIPQFAIVKEGVTAGLKPTVPDGVDWLRDNNYRGVLHILRAGEVDSADRRLFESKGLQYHRIILSPLTIDKAAAEFNRIVGTPSNRPLFVYDKDGLSAGALWYLHFRMVDGDSDAAARRKAKNLGLSEDSSGEAKALWLAIQKLMSELGS
ncbi:MAG: hypothetical protein KatS3mg105_2962 [Gemmatales bacterium]|nr:MAG: hypothetical protein KatS3mg105_2962 [Gemmatales bacterium]